jgi:GT2 family glycosyltransferase/tetratricopeptide (TPR) repeat protein
MSNQQSPSTTPLRFVLYTSSHGNYFFHEIRDLLASGLRELGHRVDYRDETRAFDKQADWHMVIAAHEFFELGQGKALAQRKWPVNLILLNTEQPSSHWLKLSAKHFDRAATIWDIDFESSLRICKSGYACDYLALGFVPDGPMFQEVARLPLHDETRCLSSEVRDRPGFGLSFRERPIDVFFLGHGSERRERFFATYAERLNRLRCFLHKPSVMRPLIPGQTTKMNTLTTVGLAQRSKVLLNIHHGSDRYFEWHRLVLLGMAQHALVITEPCSIAPPFRAGRDYVEASLDQLPERIEYYLGSPAGQEEAQQIVENSFETLTKRCLLSDSLKPLVERLKTSTTAHVCTAARVFPVVPVAAKPHRPISVCVVTHDVTGEGPHTDTGSAQVVLAEMLAQAGHSVTLLHTEAQYGGLGSIGHWRQYFANRGVDYQALPADAKAPVESSEACLRAYEIYQWLRLQSFQVVHFPETQGVGFYSLLAKKQGLEFARTLFCVNAHSPRSWRRLSHQELISNPYELELDFMEKECVRMAGALVTSTQSMLDWLEQQKWTLPSLRQVRPNPVPVRASGAPVRIKELVYFGSLGLCPGLALFCDALERLNPESLRGLAITFRDNRAVTGTLKHLQYLQERSLKWSFAWNVVPHQDSGLAQFMQGQGRLLVMPSPVENSPLVLRQCLASGLPFLAVRHGGVSEMIDPADHASSLCAGSSAALTAALERAIREGAVPARAEPGHAEQINAWLRWHENWVGQQQLASAGPSEPARTPLVSVCLVHFNRPEYLAQSLASLRAQDYGPFEVVLVDDGSTRPEALAYLKSLEPEFNARKWQIVRQPNSYLGAARNAAARQARGEYLLFMDDDNFAKPHEISTFVRAAVNSGAEILTSAMDVFAGKEAPSSKLKPKARWVFLGPAVGTGAIRNCFGDANGFIRRETFWRVGGFTEDYGVTHEDWEFYARAALQGCHMETTPEALFWYRTAEQSMLRNTSLFANLQRSLRPYLEAVPPSLQGLIHFLQGSTCSPSVEAVPVLNQQPLLRVHQRLIAFAQQLIQGGQALSAEILLLEVVQSAEATGQVAVVQQALLDIGSAMIESDRWQIAIKILESAVQQNRAMGDPLALAAAQTLLDKARRGGTSTRKSATALPHAPANPAVPHVNGCAAQLMPIPCAPSVPIMQESPPGVAIVIPTFNKLDHIRRCLQAIFAHTPGPAFEIIVVDNGSTDGTVDFLRAEEAAGRLRGILNSDNIGFAKACNQGAKAARGAYVVFLNNDTEVQSNWLGALFSLAEADAKVAAVGSKLLFPNGTIQHAGIALADCWDHDPLLAFHLFAQERSDFPLANQRRVYQAVTAACMLVRKAHFDQAGGFDEEYWNGCEDVDLCLRFQQLGWLTVYEPASVVIHHASPSGPEASRCVPQNVERFHKKWLDHASPDVTIDQEGKNRMAPNSVMRLYSPPPGKLVSIIILAHNQLRDTQHCLASIERHTSLSHELILVDNGSTDGTSQYFRNYAAKHSHVRVIFNRANLGFSAGNNQGLACARGESILLLNNDTVVTPGWLERMLTHLHLYPDCGLVGPVSNSVSGPQLVSTANYSSLDQLPKFATQWCATHAGQSTEAARLVGFCLLFRRAVMEKIGGLDPQYGSGNFEDDDFCIRAGLAGFKLRIALDSFVHHTGGQTFKGAKIDYRASMERNWAVFKAKWAMPQDAPLEKGYRLPSCAPDGLALRQPLPDLKDSHTSSLEGRCWTDKTLPGVAPKKSSRQAALLALPPCALLGHLGEARELVRKRQWTAAWTAAISAILARPYHPEAYLLLAEIALAAGDADSARLCAQAARDMAPDWAPPKQFLKGHLRGHAKPAWLNLPPALANQPAAAPRVSVCLIAKNEERFLAQCLRSVRELATQIVVVDTGSTDRTVEIAREFGAEVHAFAWCDDFSAARNAALEHATGDWVLIIDADEELAPQQTETAKRQIQAAAVLGYRLPIIDHGHEDGGCSYVPRLFRNAPGVFFVGRIHEQAFSSIQVRCQQWGLQHQLGEVVLLHHGYTDEVMASRNKIERNLRLLERAIEELPGEPNLIMSLGLELVRSGKLEAGLERYWEAFQLMSAQPDAEVTPELRETLLTQLSTQLMAAKRFSEIVQLWQMPFARKGGLTASQHFCLGVALMELKQPAEAAEQMRQCAAKRDQPVLSPINREIRKAGPHHCLAICLIALNDAEGAQRAFDAALAADAASRPMRFDLARFHAAQGRIGEALQIVRQLAAENPAESRVWELGGQIALNRPEHLAFARDWTSEAVKHFPQDQNLLGQRAEALLLNQDVAEALPLWRRGQAPGALRQRAAIVICELLTGDRQHHFTAAEEPAMSQEVVKWYRQCIRMGAHALINQLHERMETIRLTLPAFVRVLEAAHRQARQAAA